MKKNNSSSLIVQKYGGATLSDTHHIRNVAEHISELSRQGHQLIIVVSAMGKTTDHLVQLAQSISSHPSAREMDMLLSTGERISMALLTMALKDQGCSAISLTGSQSGILTDSSHVRALIQELKPHRVREALDQGTIVVLAGFQGVCAKNKEITTLGRGGSDISALAMATHFRAHRCEILKDVLGVYTCDPHLIRESKLLPHLTHTQLLSITFWGAKVLHYRSAELAWRNNIPIHIGPVDFSISSGSSDFSNSPDSPVLGTSITTPNASFHSLENQPMSYESSQILSLSSHSKVLRLLVSDSPESSNSPGSSLLSNDFESEIPKTGNIKTALGLWSHFLSHHNLPPLQIVHIDQKTDGVELWVTGPKEILEILEELKNSEPSGEGNKNLHFLSPFAAITATCVGDAQALLVQILTQLEKRDDFEKPILATIKSETGSPGNKIQIHKVLFGPISLTLILDPNESLSVLEKLHKLIDQVNP